MSLSLLQPRFHCWLLSACVRGGGGGSREEHLFFGKCKKVPSVAEAIGGIRVSGGGVGRAVGYCEGLRWSRGCGRMGVLWDSERY